MRIIIREYLSMLKESGELDALLPDLLMSMGIEPLSKPTPGVRQYGVDLEAVGPDQEYNDIKTLFLFTIKQGDLRRSDWDGGNQKVRESLTEIIDVYIPTHIAPEHKDLPIKIVLCYGGKFGQDIRLNYASFSKNHSVPGKREFDHWGGDKLSELIETYFLDEYLFPESARKNMRKTLAFLEDNDYDLHHFYSLIDDTLFDRKLPKSRNAASQRKRIKALRLIHLSLSIIYRWADEGGNLRPALLAAERTLLRCWDWIRLRNLFTNKKILAEYYKILLSYRSIAAAYFNKLQPLCYTRDGLFGYAADEFEYALRVFEVIGVLGTIGLDQMYMFMVTEDEKHIESLQIITDALVHVIENNPISASPCYDAHGIDICIGLLLLHPTSKEKSSIWIEHLRGKMAFAYATGQHFPIASDSYEDLLELRLGGSSRKEKLMDISTIYPILAEWCAVLGIKDVYDKIRQEVDEIGDKINLQLWYPDEETESYLYKDYAAHESGSTQSPYLLPTTLEDLQKDINEVQDKAISPDQITCIKYGLPQLGLIASRHFRTPVFPIYWQQSVLASK